MSDSNTSAPGGLGEAALIDVGAWQVIEATGGDRIAFLHRLLTASIEGLMPGEGRWALLLTIKGQIAADMLLLVKPEAVLLVVPPGQGDVAAAALGRYAIMDDVALRVLPGQGVLAIYGRNGAAVAGALTAAGVSAAQGLDSGRAWGHVQSDGATCVSAPGYGGAGVWLIADEATRTRWQAALAGAGVTTVPPDQAEGLRILAGEPKFGSEITGEVFPMEVGLDGRIDYGKGCYLGQEPIVRIRDRGHINWRLVGLRLREDGPVAPGDRLEAETKPKAGRITSAARLPAGPGQPTGPIALALLHVSLPIGSTVNVRHEDRALAADVVALGGGGDGGAR